MLDSWISFPLFYLCRYLVQPKSKSNILSCIYFISLKPVNQTKVIFCLFRQNKEEEKLTLIDWLSQCLLEYLVEC